MENRKIEELCNDLEYRAGRRRPLRLPDGTQLYAFDVMLLAAYMPRGDSGLPFVCCVAEPGDSGSIALLPPEVLRAH